MDRVLRGLEEPQVIGTAVVLGLALVGLAALILPVRSELAAAKSDCDQVLNLVHRIPGVGGAQAGNYLYW